MSLRFGGVAMLAGAVLLFGLAARQPGDGHSAAAGAKHVSDAAHEPHPGPTPVLVELFTSEGCSSCPPADALLSRLGRMQPVRGAEIVAVEEHVNYWDSLGWKDPFSSEPATARQNEYGEAFGGREVYTPQMVVDGHSEFVGSSEDDAVNAIRAASQAPKPAIQLSWETGDVLIIHVEPLTNAAPVGQAEAVLVITENRLHSDVRRGENAGRALEHDGVARQFQRLGKVESGSSIFSSTVAVHSAREWNRANLRAVVFVEEERTRCVLAVKEIPFPS
jgi:hypothetical protein